MSWPRGKWRRDKLAGRWAKKDLVRTISDCTKTKRKLRCGKEGNLRRLVKRKLYGRGKGGD